MFENHLNPHVSSHWIALAEYSQMSTHKPGFQSFFKVFLASFCVGPILATTSIRVKLHALGNWFVCLCYEEDLH